MSSKTSLKNSVIDWSSTIDMIDSVRIDELGVKERTSSLATRSIKRDSKLEGLMKIVSMCDLTTLEGEDTEGKIAQMSSKAMTPDPSDADVPNAAAVCVYPSLVSTAKNIVRNSNVKVASVSSYFPSGQASLESKIVDTGKDNKRNIDIQIEEKPTGEISAGNDPRDWARHDRRLWPVRRPPFAASTGATTFQDRLCGGRIRRRTGPWAR